MKGPARQVTQAALSMTMRDVGRALRGGDEEDLRVALRSLHADLSVVVSREPLFPRAPSGIERRMDLVPGADAERG